MLKHTRVIVHFIKINQAKSGDYMYIFELRNNMGSFASNQTCYTENYFFSLGP